MNRIFILALFVVLLFAPAKSASAVDCAPPYINCPPGSVLIIPPADSPLLPTLPATAPAPSVVETSTTAANDALSAHTTGGTSVAGAAGGAAAGGLASKAGGKAGCTAAKAAVGAGAQAVVDATQGSAVPVIDHANAKINTVTAKSTTALETKECILDGLIVSIREALIAMITQSIIEWINNGFEGAPAFLTDLKGFLGNVADQVSLNFLNGTELGFLCTPFQAQIKLSLSVAQAPFTQQVQCSLGDVTDNIEGFLGGNFSQGGFPALFRLSLETQNNPYGAWLMSKDELEGRIASAQSVGIFDLQLGKGLFSSGTCTGAAPADGHKITTSADCEANNGDWTVSTPGTVIEHQLNNTIGSGQRQLELADEIDEIISALMAQLAQKALTSLQGLSGLSSRSSSSANASGSYLEQLTDSTGGASVDAARQVLVMQLAGAASLESDYQSFLMNSLAVLDEERDLLKARYQCYVGLGGTGSAQGAQAATTTLATVIAKTQQFQTALAASEHNVDSLSAIEAQANAAVTTEDLNAAGNLYDALVQSGALNTSTGLLLLQNAYVAEAAALAAMKTETGDQCLDPTQ